MHAWNGGLLSQPQQPETPVERAAIVTSIKRLDCVGYIKDSESVDVVHKHLYPESVDAADGPPYPKSPINPRCFSLHVCMCTNVVGACAWNTIWQSVLL